MLAIIGAIIGLFGSLVPEGLKIWRAKLEMQHELAILKIQAEMAIKEHQYRLEEINIQADIAAEQATYKAAEIKYTGIKWIDGTLALWNGIMRPWIATVMVGFYGLVKYAQYKVIAAGGTDTWKTVWNLWTSEDMTVYATIIAFFFGGRIIKYAMNQGGAFMPRQMNNGSNGPIEPTVIITPISPVSKPEKPKELKPNILEELRPSIVGGP